MNLRPVTLKQIGFTSCEHPIREVRAVPGHHRNFYYCITCGACAGSGAWKSGIFGMDHCINYELIEKYNQHEQFEFWIRQRPESRTFGDI